MSSFNPLNAITKWILMTIAGFLGLFVGTFILTWLGGELGVLIFNKLTGSHATWGIAMTTTTLSSAFDFMGQWVPFIFKCIQWVFWLLIGSWSGTIPNPF
ncbi:MAG: hypothetical protein ACTSPP_09835 [Candidatus Heimdallarchaeaceae archaeon]